jgi:hypothetical protein
MTNAFPGKGIECNKLMLAEHKDPLVIYVTCPIQLLNELTLFFKPSQTLIEKNFNSVCS